MQSKKYRMRPQDYVKEVAFVTQEVIDGVVTGKRFVHYRCLHDDNTVAGRVELRRVDVLKDVSPFLGQSLVTHLVPRVKRIFTPTPK